MLFLLFWLSNSKIFVGKKWFLLPIHVWTKLTTIWKFVLGGEVVITYFQYNFPLICNTHVKFPTYWKIAHVALNKNNSWHISSTGSPYYSWSMLFHYRVDKKNSITIFFKRRARFPFFFFKASRKSYRKLI